MPTSLIVLIVSLIFLGLIVIGLLATKKSDNRLISTRMNQVRDRLKQSGIESSLVDVENDGTYLHKLDRTIRGGSYFHIKAICDVQRQNIDYILYVIVTGGSRSANYLEYMVHGNERKPETPALSLPREKVTGNSKKKIHVSFSPKTVTLSLKKSNVLWGHVSDMAWKGDHGLAQELNQDHELKRLLIKKLNENSHLRTIYVYYERWWDCALIRTRVFVPDTTDLEILNLIAHQVKDSWFV